MSAAAQLFGTNKGHQPRVIWHFVEYMISVKIKSSSSCDNIILWAIKEGYVEHFDAVKMQFSRLNIKF